MLAAKLSGSPPQSCWALVSQSISKFRKTVKDRGAQRAAVYVSGTTEQLKESSPTPGCPFTWMPSPASGSDTALVHPRAVDTLLASLGSSLHCGLSLRVDPPRPA